MRSKSYVDKMAAAFPGMPLLALGLWFAWTHIAFNSSAWISATDLHGIRLTQISASVTIAISLVLIVAQSVAPRIAAAFARPSFPVAGGIISSAGALVVILIGPYVFGRFVPLQVAFPIFLAASFVAGVGGAMIMVKAADRFGRLFPRNAIVALAFSILVAFALYFTTIGMPVIPIVQNGPGVFQSIMFVLLPLLAGIFAALEPPRPSAEAPEYSTNRKDLPAGFWRMTIVVGILSFSESFINAYANLALPFLDSVSLFPFVLLAQGLAALLFICLAVGYEATKLSFGRLTNGIMVLAVLCVAITSFAGTFDARFFRLLPFVEQVFVFVYLCMLFFIMFQRRISALLVFGASYGIFAACAAAGWLVGTLAYPLLNGTMLVVVGVVLSFVTLAMAFMLFSEKQFDSLFETSQTIETPLSVLMSRTLHPDSTAKTTRGRFTIAIDVIADEFDLSKREKDVLRELAKGHDTSRVAEELSISWNTVRTHTRNLYGKIGVHSRQELVDLVDSYKE